MWAAYFAIEPWGQEGRLLAILVTMFANVHKKKEARRFKVRDFLPTLRDAQAEVAAQIAQAREFAVRWKERQGDDG